MTQATAIPAGVSMDTTELDIAYHDLRSRSYVCAAGA